MNNEFEKQIVFDEKQFMQEQFVPRTQAVDVPELKSFFGENPAVFTVRSLNASELSLILSADTRNRLLTKVLDKITSLSEDDRAGAILEQLGIEIDGDVPASVLQQIETAAISTSPKLNRSAWVRMARVHPVILKRIFNVAMELTGMGQIVKKKQE